MVHNQFNSEVSWGNILFILGLFALIYLILNRWSRGGKKRSVQPSLRGNKVSDSEHFKPQKESPEKSIAEEQGKLNNWIALYNTSNASSMELVYSLLLSYDIDCNISNRYSAALYPSVDGLNMILQVRSGDHQRGWEILKKHGLSVDELQI